MTPSEAPATKQERENELKPANCWIVIETFQHSYGVNQQAKIDIIQNLATHKYLARCYRKENSKWVMWPSLEMQPSSDWGEVLDQAVKRVGQPIKTIEGEAQAHHRPEN